LGACIMQLGLLFGGVEMVKKFYKFHDVMIGHVMFGTLFTMSAIQVTKYVQTWLLYHNALSEDVVVHELMAHSRKLQDERRGKGGGVETSVQAPVTPAPPTIQIGPVGGSAAAPIVTASSSSSSSSSAASSNTTSASITSSSGRARDKSPLKSGAGEDTVIDLASGTSATENGKGRDASLMVGLVPSLKRERGHRSMGNLRVQSASFSINEEDDEDLLMAGGKGERDTANKGGTHIVTGFEFSQPEALPPRGESAVQRRI
jgi:callose synthase